MKRIVDFAVHHPVTISIVTAVVLILGFFTYSKLPLDLYPEMELPVAAVITSYPGAGPEEVESQVTETIEGAINTVSNIEEIQSTSTSGNSTVIAMFDWGTNMDTVTQDIRENIGMVETWLPDGVEKPMVIKMDPSLMPIIQIAVSGGDDPAQLQSIAEDVIVPRLSRIPEVATVYITGGQEREVQVEVDPVKLENYGLSLSQVNQILAAENFNASAGKVKQGDREYFVRNMQQFESIEDIKDVAILTPAGNTVFLKDIALITDGYKDQSQLTRVDGGDAVGIHIMKQTGANTVGASQKVRQEMEQIEKELNTDLNVKYIFDQSDFIKMSISNTVRMIFEGAILAMLILFFFLRNMRSTLVIFTAIPLSIIATFVVMYFSDYTVNLLTMGGLALGVGRIVDDSIVVFENIYRHRALGLPPMEAAVKGASEVGGAVMAATLTIIAVFLPIVFVEGIASIIFKPLAMTISFAIFCSLIVAITIIPLLSSRVLTDKSMQRAAGGGRGKLGQWGQKFGGWIDNLGERYKVFLDKCLHRRSWVVIVVTVLMIGSIAVTPLVGAEFLPKMDSGEISVTIETDKGSQLESTDKAVTAVEQKLRDIPEVETIFTSVGMADYMMMSSGQTNKSLLYVKLTPKGERNRTVDDVAEEIRKAITDVPGAKTTVSVMDMTSSMGSSGGGPINVQVRGDDLQVLREISNKVTEIVRNVPGTREVSNSLTDGSPEMQIKVDRKRAAAFGLTPMQISSEVSNAMAGKVVTRYKVEGDEIDVRVRYIPEGHQDMDYLKNLTLQTPQGVMIKLSQVAAFEIAQGPIQITRIDQVRKADINGYLLNRDLKTVMDEIKAETDKLDLPAGYTIEFGGENKEMMESFQSLAIALLLAILLVYAVMAVQYESFFNPFVIMFSVPTAFIGVVLGLLLTGRSLSVPAFIGLIMLVGIVVSNAIVFVDYLKQMREAGMERDEAILETGRVRLRPILMTAFSTVLAMFPLALGLGEGGETQAPLATVVIGGLLVSTVITLVLVPVVYSIFDDWGIKLSRRFRKDTGDIDLNL